MTITIQFEIDSYLAPELIALYCALVDEEVGTNPSQSSLPAALDWIRTKKIYYDDLAHWDKDSRNFMEWFMKGPYQ